MYTHRLRQLDYGPFALLSPFIVVPPRRQLIYTYICEIVLGMHAVYFWVLILLGLLSAPC